MRIGLLYFLVCVLFLSCDGNKENIAGQFELKVPIDIGPGLPPTKTHYFLHRDVSIKFSEYLSTRGLTIDDVVRVEPASAVLSALTDGTTWNFVDHATIYVFDPDNVQKEFLSYRTDFIPINVGEFLNVLPFMVDLKELFTASNIGLRTGLHFRGVSPRTIHSVLQLKFNVIVQ